MVTKAAKSEEKEPTYEELKKRLADLQEKANAPISFRVSEKGGCSVYGLGRFPVTLYREQWEKLLDVTDRLREFLKENKDKLKVKGA
jgi:hypothetical protein